MALACSRSVINYFTNLCIEFFLCEAFFLGKRKREDFFVTFFIFEKSKEGFLEFSFIKKMIKETVFLTFFVCTKKVTKKCINFSFKKSLIKRKLSYL